jgi:sugar phosphate isomerase/epimerase
MQLFLSTTFYTSSSSDLENVLPLLNKLDIDGIELGSTHIYRLDIEDIIRKIWKKRIVTHNFFPPAEDPNFVMNIASDNDEIRNLSIAHAKHCIEVASNIGAETYTIHPGFMSMPDIRKEDNNTYDFNFGPERIKKDLALGYMIDSLSVLKDIAKDLKIKLAIETEGSLTQPGVLLMETIDDYELLFSNFSEGIFLNLNIAHTRFAAIEHGYSIDEFIRRYYKYICSVEVSHNNGRVDQHLPLEEDSYVFDYLSLLPDVPYILEFRNSSIEQIKHSIELMKNFSKKGIDSESD